MQSELLNRVKSSILAVEPNAEIILYGSRARNDFHEGSDWDLLVLVDGDVDYIRTDKIRHELHEIEWDTGEVLCGIVRSRSEWTNQKTTASPLFKNIRLDGVKL